MDQDTELGGISLAEWHRRFEDQAGWTQGLRDHLFKRAGLEKARRILEVGCGTGVLTLETHRRTQALVCGVDLDPQRVQWAHQMDPASHFVTGNGLALPFPGGGFDVVFCHFLLLWVEQAKAIVDEMQRVTRAGGWVLALAEPDYGGRIDYPSALSELGRWQEEALEQQGAFPRRGRELAGLFSQAGLAEVEVGVMGGQWHFPAASQFSETEWTVLKADLGDRVPSSRLNILEDLDRKAWQRGERILYVPTFYAAGRVPQPGLFSAP